MHDVRPPGLSLGGGCTTILGPGRSSVRLARAAVRTWLAEYGIQGQAEIAELLVSELATNAVVHARGRYRLTLSLTAGRLRCTVADEGPGLAGTHGEGSDEDSENGRGLLLVDALADRWGSGCVEDGVGKEVWFELEAPAPDAPAGRTRPAPAAGPRWCLPDRATVPTLLRPTDAVMPSSSCARST
ncbi:ATP-binding protein [Streptomyces sp. NPDC058642]|uniref:ATP-binding protein n=1 Tax=Streptomyces sp. NPDC058642 TaxID=3346572 RepID=UPI00365DC84B